MPLFEIRIMDQKLSVVTQWKEKGSARLALEWAKAQAIELFGDDAGNSCRYRIEEEKPA